jgi:hypothetical protein
MFFCYHRDSKNEPLAIFGTKYGRRGAELTIMSVVETKHPYYYLKDSPDINPSKYITFKERDNGWGSLYVNIFHIINFRCRMDIPS